MRDLLQTSMKEVFEQHLGIELQQCRSRPKQEGYKARIRFSDEKDGDSIATIWLQRHTLKKVSEILLFETDPDEDTLKDLTSELANFIVGHAKMLASDKNMKCKIETPEFVGIGTLAKGSITHLYKMENRCIALQIKGENG